MKKLFTLFIFLVLCAATLFAQAPEKFSYQAVVRNASNALVANAPVGVRVSILQGGVNGTLVYMETHTAVTNANGLLTLEIGSGSVQQGIFADIDWANGPFILKTETDPAGGSSYSITSVQQLLSVPYALYAKDAGNVPNVPANVSAFTNDANYVSNTECADMDLCALAALVSSLQGQLTELQGQLAELQSTIDSLIVPDTTVTPIDTTSVVIDAKSCLGSPTVTDHEGNVYATVHIGDQCWMRENLRTTTSPSTGTYLIPPAGTSYTFTGKQAFWYNNDSATYAPLNYGLLYNWNAAVDTFNTAYGETSVNTSSSNAVLVNFTGNRRGICPAGWHLPSDAEWTQLTDYVGSQSEYTCGGNSSWIAKALASTEGWNTYTGSCTVGNDQTMNNASGFSAVPAGLCYGSSFVIAGSSAYFWSSSEDGSLDAWGRSLSYSYAGVGRGSDLKHNGRSVRCLRD